MSKEQEPTTLVNCFKIKLSISIWRLGKGKPYKVYETTSFDRTKNSSEKIKDLTSTCVMGESNDQRSLAIVFNFVKGTTY